jgi:hypothetical protein
MGHFRALENVRLSKPFGRFWLTATLCASIPSPICTGVGHFRPVTRPRTLFTWHKSLKIKIQYKAFTNRTLSKGVECTLMTLTRFTKHSEHELVLYWLSTSLQLRTPWFTTILISEVFTHIPSNRRSDHTSITFRPPLEPSPFIFRYINR